MKKKLSLIWLSVFCALFLAIAGVAMSTNATRSAKAESETVALSETKIMRSIDNTKMLLATGIKNVEAVCEVGYIIDAHEGEVTVIQGATTKYYSSITNGDDVYTAQTIFGDDSYDGLIVWEIAFELGNSYTYQAYAKYGEIVEGGIDISNAQTITSTERVSAYYTVSIDMDGGSLKNDGQEVSSLVVAAGASLSDFSSYTMEKAGYAFANWTYFDGEAYVDLPEGAVVNSDVTLKAKWVVDYELSVNAESASIYFDTTEGAGSFNLIGSHSIVPTLSVTPAGEVSYSYASNADAVATVDADGVVTAAGKGTATITVTATDVATGESQSKAVTVNVTNYYEIADKTGFDAIANDTAGYYAMTADVELGTISVQNSGYIGTFAGTLDGQGNKLSYSYADVHYVKLIKQTDAGSLIKNVYFDVKTAPNNKAGQYGVVDTNKGTIESCFVNVVFYSDGNAKNAPGEYAKAGLARSNWDTGVIKNNVIVATYEGTASSLSIVAGVIWHDYSRKTSNNMLVALAPNSNAVIPFNSYVNYKENSTPVDANNVKYTSVNGAIAAFDAFVADGFVKGDMWAKDANGISFNGKIVIEKELITEVSFANAQYTVKKAESLSVVANATVNGDAVQPTYTSSNANIAVDATTGAISTTNVGETVITATYGDKSATCTVIVYTAAFGGSVAATTLETTIEADMAGYYIFTDNVTINGNGRFLNPIGLTSYPPAASTPAPGNSTFTYFTGTLNGQGYSISVLYNWAAANSNSRDRYFIYAIGESGVVKNLSYTATDEDESTHRRSGIACLNYGTVENCFIKYNMFNGGASTNATYGKTVAVYVNYGTINNCVIYLNNRGANTALGFCTSNTGTISNSIFYHAGASKAENWQGGVKTGVTDTADIATAISGVNGENFAKGTLWTTDATAIYFNGVKVIG